MDEFHDDKLNRIATSSPLVLYSTCTWLAFNINERYYGRLHWVWCSPYFRPNPGLNYTNPPSSSPSEIYQELRKAIESGDLHNARIKKNKVGILEGAQIKRQRGVISQHDFDDITEIVNGAGVSDFRPVLYVIPFDRVANLIIPVPVSKRPHPLSVEYQIEQLPAWEFDCFELPGNP